MIIESSPNSLDPRIGIDAQSERIDELLFDALVKRDEHFNLQPSLATSWDIPDPLTYVFHLRSGVHFHNGQPLTSRDVKWTFDSITNGTIRTAKASSYRFVDHIDAPDDATVIFHLKEPWASLLWNVSDGAIGIVPFGSKGEMTAHPIGSGPFRFVSAAQDKDVVIERNPEYWGSQAHVQRVLFNVIPDPTTRALELRKGSADIATNALTADMIVAIRRDSSNLKVEQAPGTILGYLAFNTRDPILKDVRVRQAIAYAIDRRPLIQYLWRDQVRPAGSILPPNSWAYDGNVDKYPHDPERARQLLDEAGYKAVNGVRFHITFKTSTDENPRLIAAAMQQQLREVGIALDIRTYEFATFLADVTKGAFQTIHASFDWRKQRSRYLRIRLRFRPHASSRVRIAASIPIPSSMPSSPPVAKKPTSRSASKSTLRFSRSLPKIFRISISGISTTFSCTPLASAISHSIPQATTIS